MGDGAREGSDGHHCWSLGQQLFLEGGSTVIAGSAGKALQWGCGLQVKGALPVTTAFLCCRKGAHKKSLQYTCPTQ